MWAGMWTLKQCFQCVPRKEVRMGDGKVKIPGHCCGIHTWKFEWVTYSLKTLRQESKSWLCTCNLESPWQFFFLIYIYIQCKGYFAFTINTKYWLYSPYYIICPWVYLTPIDCTSYYPPLYCPSSIVTTSLFTTSESLLLFCFIN